MACIHSLCEFKALHAQLPKPWDEGDCSKFIEVTRKIHPEVFTAEYESEFQVLDALKAICFQSSGILCTTVR